MQWANITTNICHACRLQKYTYYTLALLVMPFTTKGQPGSYFKHVTPEFGTRAKTHPFIAEQEPEQKYQNSDVTEEMVPTETCLDSIIYFRLNVFYDDNNYLYVCNKMSVIFFSELWRYSSSVLKFMRNSITIVRMSLQRSTITYQIFLTLIMFINYYFAINLIIPSIN